MKTKLFEEIERSSIFRTTELSNREYHSRRCPGISSSALESIKISARHHDQYERDKLHNEISKPQCFAFGSALHDAILTPDDYESLYVLEPEGTERRSNAGKAAWKEFLEANEGKTILKRNSGEYDDFKKIQIMRDRFFSHPTVSALVQGATFEESFFALCNRTGILKKCRPDILRNDGIILDIKTTKSAYLDYFSSDILKLNYHVKAAWYMDIVEQVTGVKQTHFILIAMETTAPFGIALYNIPNIMIALGRENYTEWIDKFAKERELDYKYCYPEVIQEANVPHWIEKKVGL